MHAYSIVAPSRLHLSLHSLSIAITSLIKDAQSKGKIVIGAGCVPQAEKLHSDLENVSCVGIYNSEKIAYCLEEALKGNVVKLLDKKPLHGLSLPKVRRNKFIEMYNSY